MRPSGANEGDDHPGIRSRAARGAWRTTRMDRGLLAQAAQQEGRAGAQPAGVERYWLIATRPSALAAPESPPCTRLACSEERSSLQIAEEAAEPLSLSKSSAAPGAVLILHPLTARGTVLGAKLTVSKTISLQSRSGEVR